MDRSIQNAYIHAIRRVRYNRVGLVRNTLGVGRRIPGINDKYPTVIKSSTASVSQTYAVAEVADSDCFVVATFPAESYARECREPQFVRRRHQELGKHMGWPNPLGESSCT